MALDYTKAKKQQKKKKKNTSQIKAVGALVCHKLRKSQTFACSKFTTYCLANKRISNGMVTYVKVSGATQATKK